MQSKHQLLFFFLFVGEFYYIPYKVRYMMHFECTIGTGLTVANGCSALRKGTCAADFADKSFLWRKNGPSSKFQVSLCTLQSKVCDAPWVHDRCRVVVANGCSVYWVPSFEFNVPINIRERESSFFSYSLLSFWVLSSRKRIKFYWRINPLLGQHTSHSQLKTTVHSRCIAHLTL